MLSRSHSRAFLSCCTFISLVACGAGEKPETPADGPSTTSQPLGATGAPAKEYKLNLPLGLERLTTYIPADNPLTEEKVALGKQLYYDPRLSLDNSVACATCHNPRFGYTDGQATAKGIRSQRGGRSAPTALNRVFSEAQFWDGRAASLEEQAKGPIANPIEMGMTHEQAVARIGQIEGYRRQFRNVFGTDEVMIDHVARAIAAFERTIISGNSPVDQYLAGDRTALKPGARRGLALFNGKARCAECHTGANFTDEKYHNLGVGMNQPKPDLGRYDVTKRDADRGAFKTPTLRDVAFSAPYFHDGSAATLADVVNHYDKGGTPNPQLSPLMRPLGLTAREKQDLVEFMHGLTGEVPLSVLGPQLPEDNGAIPAPSRPAAPEHADSGARAP